MAAILDQGDYRVYLDAGFTTDALLLDDPVRGQLDNSDYRLDGSTQYFDVTDYVQAVSITRGRRKYRDPIDAGKCTIRIDDSDGTFSVVNTASPYWDPVTNRLGFQPSRKVRVERNGDRLYQGQIVTYDQELTLDNESLITIGCSDDLKQLQGVAIATHTPTPQRSGARLAAILDRPEVALFSGAGQRAISDGVANLGAQLVESGATVQDYFNRVQLAERGRIFMARDGVFTAQPRIGRTLRGTPIEFSDAQDGDTPYRSFQVVYE